jgi:hypothetical protein
VLQYYHAEHGDCLVPKFYVTTGSKIPLGEWVQNQRGKHAAGRLRQDRLIQLESLDFYFRALPDESIVAHWDRHFESLVRYKRRHGDCRVPRQYEEDRQLGIWVDAFRIRRDTLSADQRADLEALGFFLVCDRHHVVGPDRSARNVSEAVRPLFGDQNARGPVPETVWVGL